MSPTLRTLCLTLCLAAPSVATADNNGFYAGIHIAAEAMDVSAFKDIDNRHPMNTNLASQEYYGEAFSATKTETGLGLQLGYRWPLLDNKMFLAIEGEFAWHDGKAEGVIEGTEATEQRATYNANNEPDLPPFSQGPQVGENWPEWWNFEKDYSFGLSVRAGFYPEFLQRMIQPDTALYGMFGWQRIKATYDHGGPGCFMPVDGTGAGATGGCLMADDFITNYVHTVTYYDGYLGGIGVTTPIDENRGLQIEVYYLDFGDAGLEQITPSAPLWLRAHHELDTEEIGLRVRVMRHF